MNRPGNPYHIASCESFTKTRKREEIYANDYRGLELLVGSIEKFIERDYNRCRLHSAPGYRPPGEFALTRSNFSLDVCDICLDYPVGVWYLTLGRYSMA